MDFDSGDSGGASEEGDSAAQLRLRETTAGVLRHDSCRAQNTGQITAPVSSRSAGFTTDSPSAPWNHWWIAGVFPSGCFRRRCTQTSIQCCALHTALAEDGEPDAPCFNVPPPLRHIRNGSIIIPRHTTPRLRHSFDFQYTPPSQLSNRNAHAAHSQPPPHPVSQQWLNDSREAATNWCRSQSLLHRRLDRVASRCSGSLDHLLLTYASRVPHTFRHRFRDGAGYLLIYVGRLLRSFAKPHYPRSQLRTPASCIRNRRRRPKASQGSTSCIHLLALIIHPSDLFLSLLFLGFLPTTVSNSVVPVFTLASPSFVHRLYSFHISGHAVFIYGFDPLWFSRRHLYSHILPLSQCTTKYLYPSVCFILIYVNYLLHVYPSPQPLLSVLHLCQSFSVSSATCVNMNFENVEHCAAVLFALAVLYATATVSILSSLYVF